MEDTLLWTPVFVLILVFVLDLNIIIADACREPAIAMNMKIRFKRFFKTRVLN